MSERLDDINGKSVLYFINNIISERDNVENIINLVKYEEKDEEIKLDEGTNEEVKDNITRSTRGFIYERLWDLCIKFGVVDELTKKPDEKKNLLTSHIFGNPNSKDVTFDEKCWLNEFNKYLSEPIRSGKSGGYSDITFINKNDTYEDLVFISVKYFEKEKKIADYDIGKLCTLIERHKKKGRNIKLLLFVNNKEYLIKELKRQQRSSDIMIKYINPGGNFENIYDIDNLKVYYLKLRSLLEQYDFLKSKKYREKFQDYLGVLKSPFIPRFHQELFVKKINELLQIKKEKNILVGAIPRSGKSYIMAGAILDYVKKHSDKKRNFLIITPAPNETFPEYEAIFKQYIDFEKNNIHCQVVTKHDSRSKIKLFDADSNNVIIISKQKLGWGENSNDEKNYQEQEGGKLPKFKNIRELFPQNSQIKLDLIFLDEAHFGMSTTKAKQILSLITHEDFFGNTPKVFVTATYNKPLREYGIDQETSKLTWDLSDINIMKNINKETYNNNPIRDRFGKDIYDTIKDKYNIDDLKKIYKTYPKPYLITSIWEKGFLESEMPKTEGTEYGFDMEKLFTVNKNEKGYQNEFVNLEQVKIMMMYYFGYPNKSNRYEKQHIYRRRGIIPRIKNICSNECRTLQIQNSPTSQLWFMPYGNQRPIKNVVLSLLNLFNSDNNFKDVKNEYYFFIALDNIDEAELSGMKNVLIMKDSHDIKNEIGDLERKIRNAENGITQNNLIILAGARLQLGISLKNVDIVVLWNNIMSSDAIFQMLFRSMTEVNLPECDTERYCPQKKFGFMVDLNPQRALTNTILFSDNIKNEPSENKYYAIADLVNIDEDVFQDKYGDGKNKKKFIDELMTKFYDSWGKNNDSIKKLTKNIIKYDEEKLKRIEKELKNIVVTEESTIVKGDNGFNKTKKVQKNAVSKKTKKKDTKKISLSELAGEVLFEFLSLLNIFTIYSEGGEEKCFLTDKEINTDDYKFKIEDLRKDVFSKNKRLFLNILNGRLGRNKKEEYPESVIDIILSSFTDEDKKISANKIMMSQKKKYYTIKEPEKLLEFINKNLTPKEKERKESGEVFTPMWLVNEMLDKLPKEVWSRDDYKWLDPAVGIGNFPIAIYLRLMEGLKSKYSNEEERRKWILEEMLYMIDINAKNIFILRKILCGDKYKKLNIHKGSFFHTNEDESDDYKKPGIWTKKFKITKFHCIVGNPPYQNQKEGQKKSQAIWPDFVESSINFLKENGYLLFVHPNNWRNIDGHYKNVFKLLQERDLQYLTMRTFEDGAETFGGSGTNFDYYCLKNTFTTKNKTKINDIDRNNIELDLNSYNFIPSGQFNIFDKLIKGREKVNIVYDRTMYGNDKPWMSNEKKGEFKYPIVYTITQKDGLNLWYSSKKEEMFVPKVIISNGLGTYPIIDSNGKYGLSNFSYGIQDLSKNLEYIKNALNDPKFISLMEYVRFLNTKYNYKIIGAFKKDFWKEFNYKNVPKSKNNLKEIKKSIKTKKNSSPSKNNKPKSKKQRTNKKSKSLSSSNNKN